MLDLRDGFILPAAQIADPAQIPSVYTGGVRSILVLADPRNFTGISALKRTVLFFFF